MTTTLQETDLIREAAEWRMISLLFECPKGAWFERVAALTGDVTDPDLNAAAAFAAEEAGEGAYHSIFGPGGPAPGREISYRDWVQPGYLLSELAAFYDAFAYRPDTAEVPDHIAVETGFISYLRVKEAFAREFGETENAEIAASAAATFAREHLAKFATQISSALGHSGYDYLRLAGEGLLKRVGPDPDKKARPALPVLEDIDDPLFECGQL